MGSDSPASWLFGCELLNEANYLVNVLIETDPLLNDFSLRIQDGDDVRVRELATSVLFVFDAKQRRQFQHVVRPSAQQRPAFRRQVARVSVISQRGGRVAFAVEGDESEADSYAHVRG